MSVALGTAALPSAERGWLLAGGWALTAMIVVHDLDHMRQARNWCYTIPPSVLLVNVLVYVPGLASILMAWRRRRSAALVSAAAGVLIATAFAKVHLWKPFFPVWGIWNRSFLILDVDALTWWILTATVLTGVSVSMVGAYVVGRLAVGSRPDPGRSAAREP